MHSRQEQHPETEQRKADTGQILEDIGGGGKEHEEGFIWGERNDFDRKEEDRGNTVCITFPCGAVPSISAGEVTSNTLKATITHR